MAVRAPSVRGGAFLLEPVDPATVAIPEDLTDEERQVGELAREFVEREVLPNLSALERHDWEVARALLRKAGELGLLAAEIPEEYGGLGLGKRATLPITEAVAREGSFAVTFGAHTGIGTLPIVYFGTPEQKRRYLPELAAGTRVAAYSLTEPSAGSDALNARTVATRREGGGYVLRGQKQWTSNAGFADLFVIYAKVDGEQFTAFLVERGAPGLSVGPEARKMGLNASSTAAVYLDGVEVPPGNVLYEVGKGHRVAFNVLNLGRFKLGAGCAGGCRYLVSVAARYALERQQFGRPIASFGLIRQKLADMAAAAFAVESAVHRVAGLLDQALAGIDLAGDARDRAAQALAEFAAECSIVKVYGTEALDRVVDEAVQIHGGYGYMQEFEVERAYRDLRINRIFEGTNEINRLLLVETLLKRASKGELPLLAAVRALPDELLVRTVPASWGGPLDRERWMVETGKKLALMVAGLGVERHLGRIEEEQELLGLVADMVIEVFVAESAVARATRLLQERGPEAAAPALDMAQLVTEQAFGRIEQAARTALAALGEGDTLQVQLATLRKLTRVEPLNVVATRRRVAQRVLEAGARRG